MFIRDEEMMNSNAGVFYNAPGWRHPDFYAFLVLQRIFGNYSQEKNTEHLLDVNPHHYSTMHKLLVE
jgi:processing peptidase subunit beta